MRKTVHGMLSILLLVLTTAAADGAAPVSEATEECLMCHTIYHPGIVEDWKKSRHAMVTPMEALAVQGLELKVSSTSVPPDLQGSAVGCAECHTLRQTAHADTFEHNGYEIHIAVSPDDCAVCHTREREQFSKNLMAHARKNLADNSVYRQLQQSILGSPKTFGKIVQFDSADSKTRADACYYCHGTKLEFKGFETRETDDGEMDFPVIDGWPNQGVGRVNLDGSLGACTACHTRHSFSIEVARKPYTCKECHHGPDVPAYKVYSASKHGNIYSAKYTSWDFNAVPWTVGEDFTAPTCAACHISLLVNSDKEVVNQRTHQMSDRLSRRIFGLIYSHPHPKEPDTSIIRNKDHLPLPTGFNGELADNFLIGETERRRRTQTMQSTCLNCHDTSWVNGHWTKYLHTLVTTDASVKTATDLMVEAWKRGYAQGADQGGSLFDEAIERRWSDIWLFYANTIRFSSAMAGGGDYGVFANGRYQLSKEILELHDWFSMKNRLVNYPEIVSKEKTGMAE
jgi:hydroxylamine dehydrogenase